MSAHPNFNELKTAIDAQDIPKIRNLLTITVTKTYTDGTWAGSWIEEYQSEILSIQAFQTDLKLDEIIALHRLLPELLLNRINIEIAMLRAIKAADLDFLNQLLELSSSHSRFGQSLFRLNFSTIIERALAEDNPPSSLQSCVVLIIILHHQQIIVSLEEEDAASRNAKWWIYQLYFLLDPFYFVHEISANTIISMLQSPVIQAELTAANWSYSTYLLSKTAHPRILAALLENPKIFSETLWLYSSVRNRSHQNWKILLEEDAHTFQALEQKIAEKMSGISSANPEDVQGYYEPLLTYYLDSKTDAEAQIQALLTIPALVDIKKVHLQKSFHYYGPKIYAGVDQYRQLLIQVDLLKQFFDTALLSMQAELNKISVSCPRLEAIQAQYHQKTNTQDIRTILNRELPELKKELIELDRKLGSTQGFKQLFKNLLHLVASLVTLGYHYYQRKRDLGQCFFNSASIEKQVQVQQNQLKLSPRHLV